MKLNKFSFLILINLIAINNYKIIARLPDPKRDGCLLNAARQYGEGISQLNRQSLMRNSFASCANTVGFILTEDLFYKFQDCSETFAKDNNKDNFLDCTDKAFDESEPFPMLGD